MHSEDEGKPPEKRARSKKCPLCWDTIYITETRPVRWYMGQEGEPPREGGDVVLRLVMRPAGSTLAMPRDGADALGEDQEIPWHHAAEVMDYARVIRGGEDYMLDQFEAEIRTLQQQEKEDEVMFGEDNVQWVRKAVRMIRESEEKIRGIGNPPETPSKPVEPKRPPIVFNEDHEIPEMYSILNATKSGQSLNSTPNTHTPTPEATPAVSTTQSDTAGAHASNPRKLSVTSHSSKASHGISATLAEMRDRQQHGSNHTPSEYYFYQALLHYYLSPLDIRILKAEFGNFASFPATILPRVERVSTGVVDDELRKRTRYLAHLPYGCEVNFLECDWTDTVSPEVLEQFRPEIEKRRKRNFDKESREEKARIRAEKAEYAEFASARRKRPSVSERFRPDDFQPLIVSGSVSDDTALAPDAEGSASSPPWPARRGQGFASLASPSTSPSAPRTVWGTTAIARPGSPKMDPLDHDNRDDGWLQGWEKDLLQEEDLIAQAQAMSLAEGESSRAGAQAGGGGGKKKKGKAKKITLMSTNVRRGA